MELVHVHGLDVGYSGMRMGHPGLRCLLGHVAAHQLGNYVVGTVDRHPRRSEDAAATGQATDRRAGRHRGGRRPRGRVVSVVEPAGLDRSQQELFGMAGRWLRRGRTGRSASRTTLRPRPLRRGRCRVRWRANPTCRSTRSAGGQSALGWLPARSPGRHLECWHPTLGAAIAITI
jgi:hypothetical protein